MATQLFNFPGVVVSNANLPLLQTYRQAFQAVSGLNWWDCVDPAFQTPAGSKLQNVAAKAGAGNLAQSTDARRPTLVGGEAVFSSAAATVLAYDGAFPTASNQDHTVAVIIRHDAFSTSVSENLLGISTPSTTRHNLFLQINGTVRYAVGPTFADAPLPVITAGAPQVVLIVADFTAASNLVRVRANGLADVLRGGAAPTFPLVNSFFAGAALSTGANGLNGSLLDVFEASSALVDTDAYDLMVSFARYIRFAPV